MALNFKNVGLYVPKEKFNTRNLEEMLNYFLVEELGVKNAHFRVDLFGKEDGSAEFGIILFNDLHPRESVKEAYSMLTKHSEVRVNRASGEASYNRTPYSDWPVWKNYQNIPTDMWIDEEE